MAATVGTAVSNDTLTANTFTLINGTIGVGADTDGLSETFYVLPTLGKPDSKVLIYVLNKSLGAVGVELTKGDYWAGVASSTSVSVAADTGVTNNQNLFAAVIDTAKFKVMSSGTIHVKITPATGTKLTSGVFCGCVQLP